VEERPGARAEDQCIGGVWDEPLQVLGQGAGDGRGQVHRPPSSVGLRLAHQPSAIDVTNGADPLHAMPVGHDVRTAQRGRLAEPQASEGENQHKRPVARRPRLLAETVSEGLHLGDGQGTGRSRRLGDPRVAQLAGVGRDHLVGDGHAEDRAE
jgi:hypothetical protein